jgi:hypothetical protein
MTLRATFAALLMLIGAPSQAQPPGPGTMKASNTFVACLVNAAKKLDKGQGDAASMGRSIQGACLNEQHSWEQAQTANYTAEKRRDFLEGMKAQIASIAVQIVTEQRKFKPLFR